MKTRSVHTFLLPMLLAGFGFSAVSSQSQTTIIGNWEGGSSDGWLDWNGGSPVSISTLPSKYSFSTTTGVTLGSESLELTQTGYNQGLAISLSSSQKAAFFNDTELSFDVTYPAQTFSSGFQEIYEVALVAPGVGFDDLTANPIPAASVIYSGSTSAQTFHIVIDYSASLASIIPNPSYIYFVFVSNTDANHPNYYFDNVELVSVPVQLKINPSGSNVILTWPTNAIGFTLQSITNLSSGSWSNVTSGITIVGTNYMFTNTVNGNSAFFRLMQ
jgi:hypothetical protein